MAINIQWLCYLLASIYVLFKTKEREKEKTDYFSEVRLWILCLLSGTLILWTIFFFVDLSFFIIGSITFSVLFYSFFLYFFFRKKQVSSIFQNDIKYADKKIDDNKANTLLEQLYVYMRDQKPYRNPTLKSLDVAAQLNISTHQLSQVLNDNLGKSFTSFVNEYRIEEAKRIIRDDTKYTLEAIGNESGFNSKSTFYTTFKRMVGKTPAKYKEQF
ncbi:helix-turn-helix domain-containing protein [Maribacter halichondriae]|uniref:helix-turn-helix domain-containing protein n=1 Tax=Maribacter halichondriae TaxID=2980554 RepID=UPI002359046A|nr:helix-turn-helix domain-containing protein [Maribacter sp. Hal144]